MDSIPYALFLYLISGKMQKSNVTSFLRVALKKTCKKTRKKKSISRIIGVIMLIVAIVFIMFALNHPEKSFPWNNTITWLLYGVYFLVAVVLLIAPRIKK